MPALFCFFALLYAPVAFADDSNGPTLRTDPRIGEAELLIVYVRSAIQEWQLTAKEMAPTLGVEELRGSLQRIDKLRVAIAKDAAGKMANNENLRRFFTRSESSAKKMLQQGFFEGTLTTEQRLTLEKAQKTLVETYHLPDRFERIEEYLEKTDEMLEAVLEYSDVVERNASEEAIADAFRDLSKKSEKHTVDSVTGLGILLVRLKAFPKTYATILRPRVEARLDASEAELRARIATLLAPRPTNTPTQGAAAPSAPAKTGKPPIIPSEAPASAKGTN